MAEETQASQNTQASENSIAVGSVSVGSSIGGSLIIGSHNVIGFTSDQVSALITQIKSTFQPRSLEGHSPYKGLDIFREEDAELFFGREKWVEDLVSRVKENRTLFIIGQSGSGKSSLVRAGLIPALKKAAYSEAWLYATLRPGRDPVDALANALSRLKDLSLGRYLREHANSITALHECVEFVLSEHTDQRLVLFIDQFEEVFTQLSPEQAQTFINLLAHAVTIENGRVILLFSMRSEFILNCSAHPQLNTLLNQQLVQIGAMQPEELVSAIAQPALRMGLTIGPDLIAQIINDMQGEPGALPLMQFALKDLFDSGQAKGTLTALTLHEYIERGGIQKSLERHADTAFSELNENEQELARNIFSRLIEIGRGTVITRRTALFTELIVGTRAGVVNTVVQKLATARLVTTNRVNVTISHEKLIDAWPWLKKLAAENREVIALQNEIANDAKEWDEHGRDPSYLYTGARLANAREKLEAQKLELNELSQIFVDAAIQMEEGRRLEEERRRQRELDDARQLAEAAQARARAERRGRLIGRWLLLLAGVLIVVLSYDPIRREILRQKAMTPEMINIPEGDYDLGDIVKWSEAYPSEYLIPDTYHIAAFSIDTYQVTNRRYGFCIQAGVCSRPNALRSNYTDKEYAEKPVVNVTATDAAEFCHWIGQILPSDKQWELAARQKIFKVAGNIWEWTRSPYNQKESEWTDTSKDPPIDLTKKGGIHDQPLEESLTFRQSTSSTESTDATGFRCVIDH